MLMYSFGKGILTTCKWNSYHFDAIAADVLRGKKICLFQHIFYFSLHSRKCLSV